MRFFFWLTVLCAAAWTRAPADQLMIHVVDGTGGRLMVPLELDAFGIRVATVRAEGADLVRFERTVPLAPTVGSASSTEAVTLPQTLAIVPADVGSTGSVRIEVVALRGGRVVQRIERVAAFGAGRVDVPEFALTPLCFGVVCPPGQTCEADGTCRDTMVSLDGGGPPADAGPCGVGLVDCGGVCVPSDDANCGACGNACPTGRRCVVSTCTCPAGLTPCGDACIDTAADPANCGACGVACTAPNAMTACMTGACRITGCNGGFSNCDGMQENGCETRLGTDDDCNGCGDRCSAPNGSATCVGGDCMLSACNGGWDDCDGRDENGCETRLGTYDHCGGCGDRCDRPNASTSCGSGRCNIDSCNGGFGNCNGNAGDGCETGLDGDESNCGSCGNRCAEGEQCSGGGCECLNNGNWSDVRGPCLPSCGALLNMEGVPRGGTSCCPASGCSTAVVGGGPWASWDCNFCCEAAPGVFGCN